VVASIITSAMEMTALGCNTLTGLVVAMAIIKLYWYTFGFCSCTVLVHNFI
jgi:hypothetical protein